MTHRAVAAEAGVSLSSMTYSFRSRDDIVSAALRRVAALEIELGELAIEWSRAVQELAEEMLAAAGEEVTWPRPGVAVRLLPVVERLLEALIPADTGGPSPRAPR